jgi:uncharacterized protein
MLDPVTPNLAAAALYVGVLILMNIVLQVRVIVMRRSKLIGIGDGQDKEMARRIRVHGNFVENAMFGIGALIMLALIGAQAAVIHGVGVLLLAGRVAHAIGLGRSAGSSVGRVAGMMLSFTALSIAALVLIARAIF